MAVLLEAIERPPYFWKWLVNSLSSDKQTLKGKGMKERLRSMWRGVCVDFRQGLRDGPYLFLAPVSPGVWRHAIRAGRQDGWKAGFEAFDTAWQLQADGKLRWL